MTRTTRRRETLCFTPSREGQYVVPSAKEGPGIDPPPFDPHYHVQSESVRFCVRVGSRWIGASINRRVLHYALRPQAIGEDPLDTYRIHADLLSRVVTARVEGGALEPVMLREHEVRMASQASR